MAEKKGHSNSMDTRLPIPIHNEKITPINTHLPTASDSRFVAGPPTFF